MKYTSVLPAESRIIERSDASLHHGAVLECIMAQGTNSKMKSKSFWKISVCVWILATLYSITYLDRWFFFLVPSFFSEMNISIK